MSDVYMIRGEYRGDEMSDVKDLYVLVRVPGSEIDGSAYELLDLIVGHDAKVHVEGLRLDGYIVQASVGRLPS